MIKTQYEEKRAEMRAGDVIAFGGKGQLSGLIKWATRSAVSHVGVILQSVIRHDESSSETRFFNQIIESTSIRGFSGVTINRLSDRLYEYADGEVWWLPLSDAVRARMSLVRFYNWLMRQDRKEYDAPQAIRSAFDALDRVPLLSGLTLNVEDYSRFFCSELVAAALEESGAVPALNSAEVTPIDLCRFAIYRGDYYLLQGKDHVIGGYNTLSPEGWGM